MAMLAAAASPRFRLLGEPPVEDEEVEEEQDEKESEEVAGSGDGRLSPAVAAAAISEPMRSGKLRRAREPRMR